MFQVPGGIIKQVFLFLQAPCTPDAAGCWLGKRLDLAQADIFKRLEQQARTETNGGVDQTLGRHAGKDGKGLLLSNRPAVFAFVNLVDGDPALAVVIVIQPGPDLRAA